MNASVAPPAREPKATPRLQRTTFTTSRLLDFLSQRELVAQTGHDVSDWPMVIVKELLDNALDACEDAGTPPVLSVMVDRQGITVTDNGPGLPASTVTALLDFTVRVSSREAYVSPSRGAQGNALKTIVAMPFVLDPEHGGSITITAQGVRHRIRIEADRIRQEPVVHHETEPVPETSGTTITVDWPEIHLDELTVARINFLQIASDFATLNPHLTLSVEWFGTRTDFAATDATWTKWTPGDPTSPHWYQAEHLARLVGAYLSHDDDRGTTKTVREFVSEFRGLSGSTKPKRVLEAAGLTREHLTDLITGKDLDPRAIRRLLGAMQNQSMPVRPALLGILGEAHLKARVAALSGELKTFRYACKKGTTKGLPWVIEVAFAMGPTAMMRRDFTVGVNWSAALINPFRSLGALGGSLDSVLAELRVNEREPALLVVHLALPRVQYTDRGKSAVVLETDTVDTAAHTFTNVTIAGALRHCVTLVTKQWTRVRKAEERHPERMSRRHEYMVRDRRVTIKEAAAEVMEAAYLKASASGTLPAGARQVMYAARDYIQKRTGGRTLNDQYFTQTLLPDYMKAHAEETENWDVVFDARGHFAEPHTQHIVPLGTLEVRGYLKDIETFTVPGPAREFEAAEGQMPFPTKGPRHRYRAVLFIEKEGFEPLFRAVRLRERFDLAIMSTKGLSVTACRKFVDTHCGVGGVPLFVVHDFDKSGFSIAATLVGDTRRYEFENKVKVIDLGLRLADVQAEGLQSEDVTYTGDPRWNLKANGATDAEIEYLYTGENGDKYVGQRVELNAFTSDAFVQWLEAKLVDHGVMKVIPSATDLAVAFKRSLVVEQVRHQMDDTIAKATEAVRTIPVPPALHWKVTAALKEDPTMAWDETIAALAREAVKRHARPPAGARHHIEVEEEG